MGGAVLKTLVLLVVAVVSCASALPTAVGAPGTSRESLTPAESFAFGFGWGPWGWPGYGLGYPFWG